MNWLDNNNGDCGNAIPKVFLIIAHNDNVISVDLGYEDFDVIGVYTNEDLIKRVCKQINDRGLTYEVIDLEVDREVEII